jgi:CRISPR/Cas system-associated protein Csm6
MLWQGLPTLKDALISSEEIWINCNNTHCQHAKQTTADALYEMLGDISLADIRKKARCDICQQRQTSLTLIAKTPGYKGPVLEFSNC